MRVRRSSGSARAIGRRNDSADVFMVLSFELMSPHAIRQRRVSSITERREGGLPRSGKFGGAVRSRLTVDQRLGLAQCDVRRAPPLDWTAKAHPEEHEV